MEHCSPIDQSTGHADHNYYGGLLIAESIHEENRPLIAAAPDLLEVCKSFENDDGRVPETIWAMRNAAIAKAEGREL